jgi:hypothetical protein
MNVTVTSYSVAFLSDKSAKRDGCHRCERIAMMTVEERTVLLYDTPCTITISHPSKTVWIAVGDYRGGRIEVKGSSPNNAAKHWVDAARFSGN